jgi:hypothetical protein
MERHFLISSIHFAEVFHGMKRTLQASRFKPKLEISPMELKLLEGDLKVTFYANNPLHEINFSFNREAILKLKTRMNDWR